MTRVLKNLYIGNVNIARDLEMLKKLGITHILNISDYPSAFPDDFEYVRLKMKDSGDEPINEIVELVLPFINSGVKHGKILVHCTHGISRSAAIVIGYLMTTLELSEQKAFDYLKERYPPANPHMMFRARLMSQSTNRSLRNNF